MNGKLIGWLAAGVALATGVGALVWYLKERKAKAEGGPKAKDGPEPGKPPREPKGDEDATPDSQKDNPDPTRNLPAFDFLDREKLPEILVQAIDDSFGDGWNVSEQVLDEIEVDDVVAFAVESEATGPYTRTIEEVLTAHILLVEEKTVHARVMGPVEHSEHLGNVAGHGLRPGRLVDIPKSKILVAAAETRGDGYGGHGDPAATFKPSSITRKSHRIRPGTPYDLQLPYRTEELEWYVDPKATKMIHVGEDGLLEQVVFPEDSPRGKIIVRCLDNDPKVGKVLVGRWEFTLEA